MLKLRKIKKTRYVKYSPTEQEIFRLLPRAESRKIDTETLTKKFYEMRKVKNLPYNGRIIVNGSVRSLMRKAVRNREPFKIMHTGRAGPHPAYVWIEPHD